MVLNGAKRPDSSKQVNSVEISFGFFDA